MHIFQNRGYPENRRISRVQQFDKKKEKHGKIDNKVEERISVHRDRMKKKSSIKKRQRYKDKFARERKAQHGIIPSKIYICF